MTVTSYMRSKNKILREHIGIDFDLVPEDQIKECTQYLLSVDDSANSCPYCLEYLEGDCRGCPMRIAGNECDDSDDGDDTWARYIAYAEEMGIDMHTFPASLAYEPMKKLIEQYNRELTKESK